ncbi:MAG: hypothetical protein IPI85_13650 [Dehalococcoidia bacterium]|nr:hypothetical protein [Dehalococcoidia bacterium]
MRIGAAEQFFGLLDAEVRVAVELALETLSTGGEAVDVMRVQARDAVEGVAVRVAESRWRCMRNGSRAGRTSTGGPADAGPPLTRRGWLTPPGELRTSDEGAPDV